MSNVRPAIAGHFSRLRPVAWAYVALCKRISSDLQQMTYDIAPGISDSALFLLGGPRSIPGEIRPWSVLPMKLVSKVSLAAEQAVTLTDTVAMNHRETMPKLWTGLEDMKFSLLLYRIKAAQSEVRRWRRSQT